MLFLALFSLLYDLYFSLYRSLFFYFSWYFSLSYITYVLVHIDHYSSTLVGTFFSPLYNLCFSVYRSLFFYLSRYFSLSFITYVLVYTDHYSSTSKFKLKSLLKTFLSHYYSSHLEVFASPWNNILGDFLYTKLPLLCSLLLK